MSEDDIDEWLDSWIETHYAHWGTLNQAMRACIQAAADEGISERELMAACGGDLALFLEEEATAITESSGSGEMP